MIVPTATVDAPHPRHVRMNLFRTTPNGRELNVKRLAFMHLCVSDEIPVSLRHLCSAIMERAKELHRRSSLPKTSRNSYGFRA
jgi:hypothetical protein